MPDIQQPTQNPSEQIQIPLDKKQKRTHNKPRILLGAAVFLLLWNSWKIWDMASIVGRVDKYNQGVVDEMGNFSGNVKRFADDLNEIRRFLLLPEKNYNGDDHNGTDTGPVAGDQQSSKNSQAVFAFLDSLNKEEAAAKNKALGQAAFDALLSDSDFKSKIVDAGLNLGEKGDLKVKFIDGVKMLGETQENSGYKEPIYTLMFIPEENLFRIQSALGDKDFKEYTSTGFVPQIANYLTSNMGSVREKKLNDQTALETGDVQKKNAEAALLVQKKKVLDDIVHDKAFTETLATMGLKTSEKAREEQNKYIYDVVDASSQVKFSLALEISSGMIKVIRDDREVDINTFLDGQGLKKKP